MPYTLLFKSKWLYIGLLFIGMLIYFSFKILSLKYEINSITVSFNAKEKLVNEFKLANSKLEFELDKSLKVSRDNLIAVEQFEKDREQSKSLYSIKEQSYVQRIIKFRDLVQELNKERIINKDINNSRTIIIKNCEIEEVPDETINNIGY